MNPTLISILIGRLPELIALAKQWFREANPDLPVPTSEEVVAAWLVASATSVSKDDAWLAAHPE